MKSKPKPVDKKWFNPACCCCFRFLHGGFGVALNSAINMAIGFATLMSYSAFMLLHYSPSPDPPRTYNGDKFVFWYGVITIPLTAVISVYFDCRMIAALHFKVQTSGKGYLIRALIFFATEFLGWLLPIIFVENYEEKIDEYMKEEKGLLYFYLLKVNPLTIILFVFQLYSIFFVHFYMRNVKINKKRLKKKVIKRGIPLLPVNFKITHPEAQLNEPKKKFRREKNFATAPREADFFLEIQNPMRKPRNKRPPQSGECMPTACHKYLSTESFASLRKKCLLSGLLYKDSDFDVEKNSFNLAGRICQWKRPFEISSNPQYVCDGVSRFDVNQGELGNCYFLAALANLALQKKLFQKVICLEDNIIGKRDDKQYAGICRFKFFVNGAWQEVIIDDRLPVDYKGKLIFAKSMDENEYWSSLVEKAFAKLRGSYGAIGNGGHIDESMKLLTGGLTERIIVSGNESKVFPKIAQTLKKGGLVGVAKFSSHNFVGLYGRHAYSITHLTEIVTHSGRPAVPVIRIRNPWGTGDEWTGEWSDGHEIWESVDPAIRQQLKVIFKLDGEFWFPVRNFANYFDVIFTCVVD